MLRVARHADAAFKLGLTWTCNMIQRDIHDNFVSHIHHFWCGNETHIADRSRVQGEKWLTGSRFPNVHRAAEV